MARNSGPSSITNQIALRVKVSRILSSCLVTLALKDYEEGQTLDYSFDEGK